MGAYLSVCPDWQVACDGSNGVVSFPNAPVDSVHLAQRLEFPSRFKAGRYRTVRRHPILDMTPRHTRANGLQESKVENLFQTCVKHVEVLPRQISRQSVWPKSRNRKTPRGGPLFLATMYIISPSCVPFQKFAQVLEYFLTWGRRLALQRMAQPSTELVSRLLHFA